MAWSLPVAAVALTRLGGWQRWSLRLAVALVTAVACGRYWGWRLGESLAGPSPEAWGVQLLLVLLEVGIQLGGLILLAAQPLARPDVAFAFHAPQPADWPAVDVLVPTLDEPPHVLRRTLLACRALDYPRLRVLVLDDGRRPWVRHLAEELGLEALTRDNRVHAKAGNLNAALARCSGDLVAVFDADFVPIRDFLRRVVPAFADPSLGLVQTPQTFFTPDPLWRSLGMGRLLPHDEEGFYRVVQPCRDGVGSVVCAGTAFVVRRRALDEVGGFYGCLSEDYATGLGLQAAGWQVRYLPVPLAAGLAPESLADWLVQRQRWCSGTLQILFTRRNPLRLPGLNCVQRLLHLEGILVWLTPPLRLALLVSPLICLALGVAPLRLSDGAVLTILLPFVVQQWAITGWLQDRARPGLLGELHGLVGLAPLSVTVIASLLRPFGRGFRVTPKGGSQPHWRFAPLLGLPLLGLLGIQVLVLGWLVSAWADPAAYAIGPWTLGFVAATVAVLCALLVTALAAVLEPPRPDTFPWIERRVPLRWIAADGRHCRLESDALSEAAVRARLPQPEGQDLVRRRSQEVGGHLEVLLPDWSGSRPLPVAAAELADGAVVFRLAPLDLPLERRHNALLFGDSVPTPARHAPALPYLMPVLCEAFARRLRLLATPGVVRAARRWAAPVLPAFGKPSTRPANLSLSRS
jgi:cellulose synthase (UDP-forming)